MITLDLPRSQVDSTLNPIDPGERGFVDNPDLPERLRARLAGRPTAPAPTPPMPTR